MGVGVSTSTWASINKTWDKRTYLCVADELLPMHIAVVVLLSVAEQQVHSVFGTTVK